MMSNNLKLAKEIIKDIENISKEDLDKAIKEVDKEIEEKQYIVKTADELFEELEYKKKKLDFVFSRFWEEWENENLEKTISFNTEYEIVNCTDRNEHGITMQELQAITKKCQELGWI